LKLVAKFYAELILSTADYSFKALNTLLAKRSFAKIAIFTSTVFTEPFDFQLHKTKKHFCHR
jgi:hypothetical protein